MEMVLLEPKEEVWVPSMQEFREFIDQRADQWKKRDEIYIKESYLLASRPSELLLRVTPYMTAHNMTHPYGKLLTYKFEKNYKIHGEGMETQLAILLVNSAVAKRQKLKRKKDTEDPQTKASTQEVLKCKMKTVPIICDMAVEPWSKDILLWLKNHEGREKHPLAFNMTEMTCQNIIKRCLGDLNPSIHPHSLRHFRSTHLQKNYHLDPYELASITGWTIKNVLAAKGQQASPMMDTYIHVNWEDLIPKLNVPLLNAI
jgi:hypothetical protein